MNKLIGFGGLLLIILAIIIDIFMLSNIIRMNMIKESNNFEYGVIDRIFNPEKEFDVKVYVILEKDSKEFKVEILKKYFKGQIGDRVKVIVNNNRNFYVLPEYTEGTFGAYLSVLGLSLILWVSGLLMLKKSLSQILRNNNL
jgi:hypothetical protein